MSKAEALSKVEVNNSINLTLTQNDLIELAISEQLEKTQADLEKVEQELEEVKSKIEQIKGEYTSKVLESAKSDKYTIITNLAKTFKLDLSKSTKISWKNEQNDEGIIGTFKEVPEISSNTADKILYFKRHSREVDFYKFNFQHMHVDIDFHMGTHYEDRLTISLDLSVDIPKAIKKAVEAKIEPLNRRWLELLQMRFTLAEQEVNYKYGEKRIKAKVVKAALSKSQEGKEILAMLEKAANVKLLT